MEEDVFKFDSNVGIVVIGRNEGERLLGCLSIAKAQCKDVVYVDSASIDDSVSAARTLGASVEQLDTSAPYTAARGRRSGLERLIAQDPNCQYVQFIDGDCLLDESWLVTAVEFLSANPAAAVVCGRRFEARPRASFYNRIIDQEWATAIGLTATCGGDSLMRVEAVQSVGSFRADLMAGEEPELCARLRSHGWEVWRIDAAMTEHDAAITRFGQWWRRAERGGFGYAQVWSATRGGQFPLYARQIQSALLWSIFIPLTTLAGAMVLNRAWILALVPALYALQIGRIFTKVHRGFRPPERIKAAALTMAIKFAEMRGILRYWLGSAGGDTTYKQVAAPAAASASK